MVTVYGADTCEDTRRTLRHLRRLGVRHEYLDVDEDPQALARAMALNRGRRRTPVVEIDLDVLVEPGNRALTEALVRRERLTADEAHARLSVQNVGDAERVARLGVGLAALLAMSRTRGLARAPLGLAAAYGVLTGLLGWCPVFAATGVTSLEGVGDHPDEAEARRWLNEASRQTAPATGAPDASQREQ